MSTPAPPAPEKKPRWELRAFGLSIVVITVVGVLSRFLLGLLGPLFAAVGLDGFASFLVHVVPVVLALITTLVLSAVAAGSESRGAGLGAWLGFGLVMLIFRGLALY